jgi:amino acid adenylation domain-containing protein/thioester reductase-like protein
MNKLTLSQNEIANSEDTFPNTALLTVAVNLYFNAFSATQVANACDKVFESADVFKATLVYEGHSRAFYPDTQNINPCTVLEPKTLSESQAYFDNVSTNPLDYPKVLYKAVSYDLEDGGSCLVAVFHHIIIDGYGMSIFAQKVTDVLEGRELTESKFFVDDSSCVDVDGKASWEAFWNGYFKDNTASGSIYTEKPDSLSKSNITLSIDTDTQTAAKSIADRCGVNLPYVYAGAYSVYLRNATGKNSSAFLMTRLNRKPAELNTIGCYMLLIPVGINAEASEGFDSVCVNLQKSAKAASLNKGLGYSHISKIIKEESTCELPLQYGFNWYSKPLETTTGATLSISTAGASSGHLTWNLFTTANGLSSTADCRNGIYNYERITYFNEAICSIIHQCAESDKPINTVCTIGESERKRLSAIHGHTYPVDNTDTIPSLFRKVASLYPDKPALCAGGKTYTYAELDKLTDNMAKNLIERGIKVGDRVAFMLNRGEYLIPSLFAISKSGAAFIPVDPAYPKDRVEHILTDSEAAFIINSDNVSELVKPCTKDVPLPVVKQEALAYMIYTSGTTGKPKGVMLTHRGIANIVNPDNNPFNRDVVANGHGIVAIGSICFDISLFEIFVPMFNGKLVVLGDEKAMVDASALSKCILSHDVDIMHCTPSRITAYLSNPDFAEAIKKIKMILAAGEVLPANLVLTLKNTYGIHIYNGYGPTETTIGATITEACDHESIGRPIGNTEVIILNSEGKQVPYGAIGEICVSGPGLGLGYYHRDDETKSKFTTFEDKKIYRTGDLGHLLPDGRLIYHGRCDRQIKLRGLRIELSEIESVMQSYKGVSQAVCIPKKTKHSEHLVGFYTNTEGKDIGDELKQHMKAHLTEYMVPEVLIHLDSMPQTPGGKLDYRAIERIEVTFERTYVPPENDTQRLICESFAETVDESLDIGIEDNFFESGMDSLSATGFMLAIEERLPDAKIEYSDIYSYPTAKLLAQKLDNGDFVDKGFPIDGLDYSGFDTLAPISMTADKDIKSMHMGNILLTGATGYLGMHILLELLKHPDNYDKVICLVRPKGKMNVQRRMKVGLFYYGEDDFSSIQGTKWEIVEGSVTDSNLSELITCPIQTIIHTAANVAHFSHDDAIEKTNVGGVRNVINFALDKGACLCHVSTISVGGVVKHGTDISPLTEKDLYIGQEIHNQYIYSKYMAEYEIMRASIDSGLKFKIMRVGNLQGRIRDGEFQMNMNTNNFTRCLSSYAKMGAVPNSVYNALVNFSPVDEVARMIVALSGSNEADAIYHVSPDEETAYADIFAALGKTGHNITPMSDEEFESMIDKYKHDKSKQEAVEGLLAERPNMNYNDVIVTQHETSKALHTLGKFWAPITEEYLNMYINALEQLNMFEEN